MDSTCPSSVTVDHNVIFGNPWGTIEPGCGTDTSGGNRATDPLFVNHSTRALHLQAGSAAVDYALSAWSPAVDHDRRARPQGAEPDAGAFER
jgi:hypothetical protein